MFQVSGLSSGVLLQVVKSIKTKSKDKVVYSEKGEDYQFSKLEQSNYVVFVLDGFAWQQNLRIYQEVCSQNYCGA